MRPRLALPLTIVVTALLVMLVLVPVAGATKSPQPSLSPDEKALMTAISEDYAYDLTDRLSSFDFPFLGEVVSGTAEDSYASEYVAEEMRDLGLTGVKVESFDLVGWEFGDALVEVTSPESKLLTHVRSIDGCPGTPGGGPVSGELVDAGQGRRQDFAAIPGGVTGKIVIVERTMAMFYGVPAIHEAEQWGAAAVLLYSPVEPAALNQDCAHADLPALYVTADDIAYLKGLLADGPVTVAVTSPVTVNEDAEGHAVYGFIRGSVYPDEYVAIESHIDHWWAGANDDNSGIGSSLAIAKAVLDSGIQPKRSLVFMFFTGHESATGGSKDSHWDWATGPYFFFTELHPEWAPRIVEALCADGVGEESSGFFVETTPDLKDLLTKAAHDSQIDRLMTTYVFTPVSSFDSWSYYWAGTPAMTTYQFELNSILDMLGYHRDLLYGMDQIHAEYLAADARFRGLAAWRLAQADILPHRVMAESQEELTYVNWLKSAVPDADVGELKATLTSFQEKAADWQAYTNGIKHPTRDEAITVNTKTLAVLGAVTRALWDQDVGLYNAEPGWNSISKFEQYQHDIPQVKAAIKALGKGDGPAALQALHGVITMDWGADVSAAGYESTLDIFYSTPYLNWATGAMPWITNVHAEYDAIAAKVAAGETDFTAEADSLRVKLAVTYQKMGEKIAEVNEKFAAGAALLD